MDFTCIYKLYAEEYGITYQEAKDMVDAMWAEKSTEKKLYRHKKTGKLYSLLTTPTAKAVRFFGQACGNPLLYARKGIVLPSLYSWQRSRPCYDGHRIQDKSIP